MEREKKVQIQLLDYMWRMLSLFREVHRLHHLVKCLNYATTYRTRGKSDQADRSAAFKSLTLPAVNIST